MFTKILKSSTELKMNAASEIILSVTFHNSRNDVK